VQCEKSVLLTWSLQYLREWPCNKGLGVCLGANHDDDIVSQLQVGTAVFATAPRLPVETIDAIIDLVAYAEPWSTNALQACALASRALRIRSQMHLFKYFSLSDEPALHRLAKVLAYSPHLAKHARLAQLRGMVSLPSPSARKAAATVLAACSKLETLRLCGTSGIYEPAFLLPIEVGLSGALLPYAGFSLPSVTRLEIIWCEELDVNLFDAVIRYLPFLRTLVLRNGGITELWRPSIEPNQQCMLAELDIAAFTTFDNNPRDLYDLIRRTVGTVESLRLSLDYWHCVQFAAESVGGCLPAVKELCVMNTGDYGTLWLPGECL
jgi:hypothetical protein